MIKIDTTPIIYYSQLDEDYFFKWVQEIGCVKSIDGLLLHIRGKNISKMDLADLTAIFKRYKLPLKHLELFRKPSNEDWFKNAIEPYL